MTDRVVQFATAKTYVFSDSVLCLGGISAEPVKEWESKIKWFAETRFYKELDPFDGEPMEFEWANLTGFTALGILEEIQKMMTESKCELEHFQGRIIFMSMYNDIDWRKRGNRENCIANTYRVTEYVPRFTRGHWSFLGPGKLDGEWDKTAEDMMLNFAESGHPFFHASSALERGQLKGKGKGVKSIHFNGSDDTIELILRKNYFRQSAQCLRSGCGFVRTSLGFIQKLTGYGEIWRACGSGIHGYTDGISHS